MRYRIVLLAALILGSASAAGAQNAGAPPADAPQPSLQDRLMPESTTSLMAPASEETASATEAKSETTVAMQRRGSGTGLMIAGGALFVAGILIGGDAGTLLAVTGAGVGAYGLYLYFR